MNSSNPVHLELAKRSLYRLPDDAQELTVRTGTLWITQDNDLCDIVLEPGQSFTPDGHRGVLLYALAPSAFTLRSATSHPTPARPAQPRRSARALVLE